MAYSEQARQHATEKLQTRRLTAALETDRRKAQAYEKVPQLAELEARITAIGLGSVSAMLAGGDAGDIRRAMEGQIDELRAQQAALLKKHGLTPDALDDVHYCALCRDSGIDAEGHTCACVKKLLRDHTRDEIRRISPLELNDFASFSLHYYPTHADDETGAISRDVMKDNLAECRRFAAEFPSGAGNLLMMGDAGLGKTHLALSIANEVLRRGHDVLYCSAANIFRQIEAEQFTGGRDTTTLDSLKRCDLLILDDLGAEHTGHYLNSVLYDIVNTRISRHKPTICTTNITTERALTSRYGEKISSRLIGCSRTLPFFGDDIRILKNND